MGYYTILHKTIKCPFWNCELTLQGKYRFPENEEHGYIARFSSAKCPIIENLHLPERKRNKDLSIYMFCRMHPCKALQDFEPVIDVRTNRPPIE